jgi:phage shock protein PspC (stress-responsive transcriptional regulator)
MEVDLSFFAIFFIAAIVFGFMFRMLKISKNRKHKMIAGVCSGLSECSGIRVWHIRGAMLFFILFYGFGIDFYISLWLFMLKAPEDAGSKSPDSGDGKE